MAVKMILQQNKKMLFVISVLFNGEFKVALHQIKYLSRVRGALSNCYGVNVTKAVIGAYM